MIASGSVNYKAIAAIAAVIAVSAALLSDRFVNRTSELPDVTLQQLSDPNRRFSVIALRGEPGILNFWASWCVACRNEHSILMDLGRREVPVYGINFRDDREHALRWIEFYGDPYRFSLSDRDGVLGTRLDVDALPVTYVYDAKGKIVYRHLGPLDESVVDQVIAPLVESAKLREDFRVETAD